LAEAAGVVAGAIEALLGQLAALPLEAPVDTQLARADVRHRGALPRGRRRSAELP
jgi:hypothetical protein